MVDHQLVIGSIGAIAQKNNQSIAETFINADCIVIIDTSGSMDTHDSRGGKSRYDVACEELIQLQRSLPGKITVIAFSDEAIFCPSGLPAFLGGGTRMDRALDYIKIADVPGMHFILISDGEPDDGIAALKIAKTFCNRIDTIFVGNELIPTGRNFLEQLAAATGGQSITADQAKELKAGIEKLLLNSGNNQ